MADEVFDGTDVVRQVFREGPRVTDEAGDALPQRVIEALNIPTVCRGVTPLPTGACGYNSGHIEQRAAH